MKQLFQTFLCPQCFPPKCREDAISPVVCGHVKSSKHLRRCDSFGIHAHLSVRLTALWEEEERDVSFKMFKTSTDVRNEMTQPSLILATDQPLKETSSRSSYAKSILTRKC